ncbi:hypothetical protein D9756_000638 [Leucocoprinus leucothites]|uniref:Uncharacterized protein n=1 Tax=Leucocoprinus leucothites TaxID=201217 RepID=A0A8H5LNK5_9AGAR|nr:hypothetical protein D9756_000638 [Leucoagaricus leucothites]
MRPLLLMGESHCFASSTTACSLALCVGPAIPAFMHILVLLALLSLAHAQTISTSTPLPPLQWINLSTILQGTAHPPPLKDAAIGYDETSRNIIIFGGESEGGFVQDQTYLLNLDTLSWKTPSPPQTLQNTPPARAAALAGEDFAASNRHAFVIYGGKGSDGNALSDVWAFDFINQFWSPVTVSHNGPPARWGAAGGIDPRVPPFQDPVVPGPNNTFYMTGGTDGTTVFSLSDVWRLHLSGTLSSNLPNSVNGNWDKVSIGSFPGLVGEGSTVVGQQVVAVNGCGMTQPNTSCAQQDSFVLNIERSSGISPGACPAPRLRPAVVANLNPFSSSFASQVFMLVGTFNDTQWSDNGGLSKGEIDILDINTGTWTRALPSGDPGTSGIQAFPSPREGAAVLSYQTGLVGSARNSSADTILFGGRDGSGRYLSEVWLLRAYKGSITPSNLHWEGFGNGHLSTGVGADGSGVTVQYLSQCASAISTGATTTSSGSSRPTFSDPGGQSSPSNAKDQTYETSLLHKLLAALSLITLQAIVLIFRNPVRSPFTYLCAVGGLGSYGLGVAGLALAFSTISISSGSDGNSSTSPHLHTTHGVAGLVFFLCLYGIVPIWMLIKTCISRQRRPSRSASHQAGGSEHEPVNSDIVADEKSEHNMDSRSVPQSVHNISPPSSPRPRTQSWGPSSLWRRSLEAGVSSDTESVTSGSPRGFEVVNRPPRLRQPSGNTVPAEATRPVSKSLGEIDWLLRRRSLNLVGELDYALTQAHNARLSTPGTADILLAPADDIPLSQPLAKLPTVSDIILHMFMHVSILGLNILTLTVLWAHASKVFFVLFLIWTIAFYAVLVFFAWNYRPPVSILSTFFYRLRHSPSNHPASAKSSTPLPQSPLNARSASLHNTGPYLHQPPYRTAATDEYSHSHAGPRSEVDDDEIDEVTRQRMIEEEMDRREVSIVTVPKRKLWVANPS